jgi:UDP-N-acetylglucosamine 2-epimerase (non-hydrolysing)
MRHNVLFIFGTRPEAVKLCPLVRVMRTAGEVDVRVCVTAQHREMLDQVLSIFAVVPDYDLGAMRPGQTLTEVTARMLSQLGPVLSQEPKPSLVIVQGDTTTTFCGALAAFYAGVPVAHVEAGLRTGDPHQPFPEEIHRVLVGRLTTLHFAATPWAAENLQAEGVAADAVHVTGNTGIDAVLDVATRLAEGTLAPGRDWSELDPSRKLIVVTAHRRESFGDGMQRIIEAIRQLARRDDVQIVFPVHRNPSVAGPVREQLEGNSNVRLTDPLDYVSFIDLMRRSRLLLTDSGGIQEEAPSLGKPVLILREKTERPEAIQSGAGVLVGTDTDRIVKSAVALLDCSDGEYRLRAQVRNPYGDGQASRRIAAVISKAFRSGSPTYV